MARARRPQTVEQQSNFEWEPYESPGSGILRVGHTSCCGLYELASLGGQFFVLRPSEENGYEETGRGVYRKAVAAYVALVKQHRRHHLRRGEAPEYDSLLDLDQDGDGVVNPGAAGEQSPSTSCPSRRDHP